MNPQETTTPTTKINFGPQHPSTHGVLNLLVGVQGDTVVSVEPQIGFLHRGFEKLAEERRYIQFMPALEKGDYVAAFAWDDLYMSVLEKALGIEPPPRAVYLRTMLCEVQRIMSHLMWLAAFGQDLGQPTVFLWSFREREPFVEFFEEISGGRLHYYYSRPGGLKRDVSQNFLERVAASVDAFEKRLKEIEGLTTANIIFRKRTEGVGVLNKEDALSLGMSGPVLRASGVAEDIRRTDPYLAYPDVEFSVVTRDAGDCLARAEVRIEEMRESAKIVKSIAKRIPQGPIMAGPFTEQTPEKWPDIMTKANMLKVFTMNVPPGEWFMRHESPRGEIAMYLVSTGGMKPYRMRLKSPSFANLYALDRLAQGGKIADLIAVLGSLDLVFGEVDR